MARSAWVVSAAMVALAVTLVVVRNGGEPTAAGEPMLPDLWSSAPFELQLDEVDGRAVLRFTTEINNRGDGDFMVRGSARDGDFAQWIAHRDGGHTVNPVEVTTVWGGDTHFHWHIEDVARYSIVGLDGEPIGDSFDNKVGFCFFDGVDRLSELDAAPDEPVHLDSGCGSRLDPDLAMGLSVGWGDQYRFDLESQYIDIEDVQSGSYRLRAEVDPDRCFVESDDTNNAADTNFTLIVTEDRRTLLGG